MERSNQECPKREAEDHSLMKFRNQSKDTMVWHKRHWTRSEESLWVRGERGNVGLWNSPIKKKNFKEGETKDGLKTGSKCETERGKCPGTPWMTASNLHHFLSERLHTAPKIFSGRRWNTADLLTPLSDLAFQHPHLFCVTAKPSSSNLTLNSVVVINKGHSLILDSAFRHLYVLPVWGHGKAPWLRGAQGRLSRAAHCDGVRKG